MAETNRIARETRQKARQVLQGVGAGRCPTKPTKRGFTRKHRTGRPTKATRVLLEVLAAALSDGEKHPTKAAAAKAAGISLATLMRWQRLHPWLCDVWGKGRHVRYLRCVNARQAKTASHQSSPRPTRQMRLVCWFLVHRVRLLVPLTVEHMRRACAQVNFSADAWKAACQRYPRLLASVVCKRARRRAYLLEHGEIREGWTPPDPNNYRTAARAWGSFAQTRGTFLASLYTHERRHSSRRDDPWL